LGHYDNYAHGISGNNVVGFYSDSTRGIFHSFLYNGSTYVALDDPLGVNTYACGISGNNVVGYYMDSSYGIHGFLYDGTSYTTLDISGAAMTLITGIDGNNIAGNYYDSSDVEHGFEASITPVPEPTTLALVGLGGLSLFAFRRRK